VPGRWYDHKFHIEALVSRRPKSAREGITPPFPPLGSNSSTKYRLATPPPEPLFLPSVHCSIRPAFFSPSHMAREPTITTQATSLTLPRMNSWDSSVALSRFTTSHPEVWRCVQCTAVPEHMVQEPPTDVHRPVQVGVILKSAIAQEETLMRSSPHASTDMAGL